LYDLRPESIGFTKSRAKEIMEKFDLDVLIASTPPNVFYTSGLPVLSDAPNPILFVLSNQFPTITLLNREGEQHLLYWMTYQSTEKYTWIKNVTGIASKNFAMNSLISVLNEWDLSEKSINIGLESHMPRYQAEFIRSNFPKSTIVDGDQPFLAMRLIKTEKEINRIKKSTEITDNTILKLVDSAYEGITDNELIQIGRQYIVESGADGWDHFTIGLGESDPEAPGFGYKIHRNEINRFDLGVNWKGYVSDISRNLVIGTIPEDAHELMERIKAIHNFCVENVIPGANTLLLANNVKKFSKSLSKVSRVYVTIHSIGIECEELHLMSPMTKLDTQFEKNMVLDIEVWQMYKNFGLVGIEDCYVVRDSKCERLSKLPQEFFVK
jgi:Xaa-Pro aminopeptidase